MGPDQDIFMTRFFAIYDLSLVDPTTCGSVVVTYPGQPIYYNTTYVNGQNNCLDLSKQYGDLWTKTIAKGPNQFFLTQMQADPFFAPSSGTCVNNCDGLIGVSAPLMIGTKTVGIFGTHLAATSLEKIISPMTKID